MKKPADKMKGHSGKNWSETKDMRTSGVYSKSSKKPEPDDRPAKTPKERSTGTSAAKRLAGKVIG